MLLQHRGEKGAGARANETSRAAFESRQRGDRVRECGAGFLCDENNSARAPRSDSALHAVMGFLHSGPQGPEPGSHCGSGGWGENQCNCNSRCGPQFGTQCHDIGIARHVATGMQTPQNLRSAAGHILQPFFFQIFDCGYSFWNGWMIH